MNEDRFLSLLFSSLHDVDESVYYEHLCNCPDRRLLDPNLIVRGDPTPTVQNADYDVRGDITVPEYENEVSWS